MRKNKKVTKRHSVAFNHTIQFGAIIVMAFAIVIVCLLANASCNQRQKSIGKKERLLSALDKDLTREMARWDEMNNAANLKTALIKNGISMNYPEDDQIVRMNHLGVPHPGQLSVVKHGRNRNIGATANYKAKKRR